MKDKLVFLIFTIILSAILCSGLVLAVSFGSCGDGIVTGGEYCDDGADGNDANECFDDCTYTFCGDNIIQSPNGWGQEEECDGGLHCAACFIYCDEGYYLDGYGDCIEDNSSNNSLCLVEALSTQDVDVVYNLNLSEYYIYANHDIQPGQMRNFRAVARTMMACENKIHDYFGLPHIPEWLSDMFLDTQSEWQVQYYLSYEHPTESCDPEFGEEEFEYAQNLCLMRIF